MTYKVKISPVAKKHYDLFPARIRKTLKTAMLKNLLYEPSKISRNRKPLRTNPHFAWELRVGQIRVFYAIEEPDTVNILAIGAKIGNLLYIGGEEIKL